MLKFYDGNNIESEELQDKIVELLEKGHEKLKYDGDVSFFYQEGDEKEISEYLGINITKDNGETLKEFIRGCDYSGYYLTLPHRLELSQYDCVEKFLELNSKEMKKYEARIFNADDTNLEIEIIIKEQMYKVFLDIVNDGFKTINNGNFEWR